MYEIDGASYNVVRIKSAKKRELIAQVKTDQLRYMHSFGQTKNYCILMAHPAFVTFFDLATTLDPLKSLQWDPDAATNVFVVNLKTGKSVSYK